MSTMTSTGRVRIARPLARIAGTLTVTAICLAGMATSAGAAEEPGPTEPILLEGSTTASYFWDDGSGRNGDTGMPASGEPMQKGMASSPSWPLFTEGYVRYDGKRADFFVGDRGPGEPSSRGIMLDLDGQTFADLTGGTWNGSSLWVEGNGGQGHIELEYVITKWGDGVGLKNHPVPFSTGAWGRTDNNPAEPVVGEAQAAANAEAAAKAKADAEAAEQAEAEARRKAEAEARAEAEAEAGETSETKAAKGDEMVARRKEAADAAARSSRESALGTRPDGAEADTETPGAVVATDSGPMVPVTLVGFAGLLALAGAAFVLIRHAARRRSSAG